MNNNRIIKRGNSFSKGIKEVLNRTYNSPNQVKAKDNTPKVLVENGVKDLPMLITSRHVLTTVLRKEEAVKKGIKLKKKDHYHGLGEQRLIKVIESLGKPLEIYRQSANNYLIITTIKKNKKNIIVPIETNGKGLHNNIFIEENQILTAYPHRNLNKYLRNNDFQKIYTSNESALNKKVKPYAISTLGKDNVSPSLLKVSQDKISISYYEEEDKINTLIMENICPYGI